MPEAAAHRSIIAAASLLALAGCSINPPYPFEKEDKTASVKLLNMDKASMCKDGVFYSITAADGETYARVPAGQRISLGTFMNFAEYQVTYTCYPFLSFIPQPGQKYVLHNYIGKGSCYIELVREDGNKATGISFEPSMGPRSCYKK